MSEKLMTLDEIAGVASRWLSGDVRDCVLSLVEHVRRLTPEPQVAVAHCPSRSRGCACSDAGCIANVGAIGWRCELPGEHGQHGALEGATSHCRVTWTDADPVARPAPVVDPPHVCTPGPICETCGDVDRTETGSDPSPVSPRAETMAPSATRAGYDLYLRWFDPSGVYHEMRYDVRSTPQATEMAHNITSMIEAAEERGKLLGAQAGRRKGLEEACESIRGMTEHWRKRAEHYRFEEPDALAVAGCESRATALANAEASVRFLIGGDK